MLLDFVMLIPVKILVSDIFWFHGITKKMIPLHTVSISMRAELLELELVEEEVSTPLLLDRSKLGFGKKVILLRAHVCVLAEVIYQ
jgi:hypothetical protein